MNKNAKNKKQIFFAAAAVFLSGVLFAVLFDFMQRADSAEFLKKCRYYEGGWTTENEDVIVSIRRLDSTNMVFSIENISTGITTPYLVAKVTAEEQYTFHYEIKNMGFGNYSVWSGNASQGTVCLEKEGVRLLVPEVPDKPGGIAYEGLLTKKVEFEQSEKVELSDYMGTKEKVPKEAAYNCCFEYDSGGRVDRIHMLYDYTEDREKGMLTEDGSESETEEKIKEDLLYETNSFAWRIGSLGRVNFLSEAERMYGDADYEEELEGQRKKAVFCDDVFQYTYIFNVEGLLTEADCQYREIAGGYRKDDFIMQEDGTLLRYVGNYESEQVISLPEETVKIAAGAFTAYSYSYHPDYAKPLHIVIPKKVQIQPDAFRKCARLEITFQEGREAIEEGAFANMADDTCKEKMKETLSDYWVMVKLPQSIRRIEKRAFAMDVADDWYYFGDTNYPNPIVIQGLENVAYIGDYALWGIAIEEEIPQAVYLGSGCRFTDNTKLPEGLYELGEEALLLPIDAVIRLPATLKKIGEGAFGYKKNMIYLNKKNESFMLDEDACLCSKDGKELYMIGSPYRQRSAKAKDKKSYLVHIKEGIENIRAGALVNIQDTYPKIKCYLPYSLKRMSRMALLTAGASVYVEGELPQMYGEIKWKYVIRTYDGLHIYVKKGQRKKLIKRLFAGQEHLCREDRRQIKKRIREI